MNAQETISRIKRELKENNTVSLLISNGNVSKEITISSLSDMSSHYGNAADSPNTVEVGIANASPAELSTLRFDASYIKEIITRESR